MCSGLWLMLSPFLLLGNQSGFSNATASEAGILMILGLIALIMAGYSYSKHDLLQSNFRFCPWPSRCCCPMDGQVH
jgi:hypothetical protein